MNSGKAKTSHLDHRHNRLGTADVRSSRIRERLIAKAAADNPKLCSIGCDLCHRLKRTEYLRDLYHCRKLGLTFDLAVVRLARYAASRSDRTRCRAGHINNNSRTLSRAAYARAPALGAIGYGDLGLMHMDQVPLVFGADEFEDICVRQQVQ